MCWLFVCVQMEKALTGLALKTEDKAVHKEPTSQENPTVPQTSAVPNALKGVSQSLLDRVGRPGTQFFRGVDHSAVGASLRCDFLSLTAAKNTSL